ncbi:MAG: DUF86 domain-containing protein [Thermosynechococcaceae cyanobacterium]
MSRDKASLLDIFRAGQQVLAYAQGLTLSQLEVDEMRISAILYQVLIIGEATKRLSREYREEHPVIPWTRMAGMRDIVIHRYDDVNYEVLWTVIQHSIPELLSQMEPLLPTDSSE